MEQTNDPTVPQEISTSEERPWSGTFEIEANKVYRWLLGCLNLKIQRCDQEIRIAYQLKGEERDVVVFDCDAEEFPSDYHRYIFNTAPSRITITPILSARPIIFSPEKPFHLAPRETLKLFISSPLWIRIATAEPEVELLDVPTVALSDTWFGTNFMSGQVCYSALTKARLNLENVTLKPHRAISTISVINVENTILPFDRLQVPLQYLALYKARNGGFWTQPMHFEVEVGKNQTSLTIPNGPFDPETHTECISGPHEKQSHKLYKMFIALIKMGGRS